jgi:hypothetical protein
MQVRGLFGEGQIIAPTRVGLPAMSANGFVACPIGLQAIFQGNRELVEIYRLAYERSVAALRPSLYETLVNRVSIN